MTDEEDNRKVAVMTEVTVHPDGSQTLLITLTGGDTFVSEDKLKRAFASVAAPQPPDSPASSPAHAPCR